MELLLQADRLERIPDDLADRALDLQIGLDRLHQATALLEQGSTLVGRLDLVREAVRERMLTDLAREIGRLTRPVAKARTEPMDRDAVALDPSQQHQHRHMRERLLQSLAGEHEFTRSLLAMILEQAHCRGRQRDPVLAARLHPLRRGARR